MIQTLLDKAYAYQADNGDVYYDVSRFETYGKLSGKRLEDLRAGERIAVDEAKDDPLDFVLWKAAKPEEPSWDAPWGPGRPGWHIECSAMSTGCLGNHFDIHGGGLDLQFPHHENEIAQSEAATGEAFVNVWMHNGFVRVDEEKMSKSLGNFFTIREVTAKYDPEVLRYFILTSHYRSPLNYSDVHLENAKGALTTLYTALRGIEAPMRPSSKMIPMCSGSMRPCRMISIRPRRWRYCLNWHVKSTNSATLILPRRATMPRNYVLWAALLGLLERRPEDYLRGGATDGLQDADIEALIEQRTTRQAKQGLGGKRPDPG